MSILSERGGNFEIYKLKGKLEKTLVMNSYLGDVFNLEFIKFSQILKVF